MLHERKWAFCVTYGLTITHIRHPPPSTFVIFIHQLVKTYGYCGAFIRGAQMLMMFLQNVIVFDIN